MTQEQKDLLLKDLSSRLPYGVKLGFYAEATKQTYTCTLLGLEPQDDKPVIAKTDYGNFCVLADHVKPYLFPMSSMTEEQENEWDKLFTDPLCERVMTRHTREEDLLLRAKSGSTSTDYLDKNFFDHRGLIPMGLALDATGLNIY